MRKLNFLILLFTALLVSGEVWGTDGNISNPTDLTNALKNGGTYQLSTNVTCDNANLKVSNNTTIDLKNFTLTLNGSYAQAVISFNSTAMNKTLTFKGNGFIVVSTNKKFTISQSNTLIFDPSSTESMYVTGTNIINNSGTFTDNGAYFSSLPYSSAPTGEGGYNLVGDWYTKRASNDVCKIGTKGYATLAAAVAEVPDNTETTITMLKIVTENCTIPALKQIILDLQDYSIGDGSGDAIYGNANSIITITGTSKSSVNGNVHLIKSNSPTGSPAGGKAIFSTSFLGKVDGSFNVEKNSKMPSAGAVLTIHSGYFSSDPFSYLGPSSTKAAEKVGNYFQVIYTPTPICSVIPLSGSATEYTSLSTAVAAWKAAPGSTLKLLNNVTTASAIEVDVNGSFILDLNGHTLTSTSADYYAVVAGSSDPSSAKTAQLTINATGGGSITHTNASGKPAASGKGGTLIINGGTISKFIAVDASAVVTINGGTFGDQSLPMGTYNIHGGTIASFTLNGSTKLYIDGSANITGTLYIAGSSTSQVVISDGYVGGEITKSSGVITITGGEYGVDPISHLNQNLYQSNKISEDPARWRVVPKTDDDPGSQDDPTGAVVYIEANQHYGTSLTYYKTLQGALSHAKNNDQIRLMQDIALSAPIQINGSLLEDDKKVYLHLERHTITNNVQNTYMCQVLDGAQLIIVGTPDGQGTKAQLVIPNENTLSKGFFYINNSAGLFNQETLEVYNVSMTGKTDEGNFIRCFSKGATVKLQDVDADMVSAINHNILIGSYCNFSIIRGTYKYASTYNNEAVFVNEDYNEALYSTCNSAVLIENVTVHSNKHVVIETMGDNNSFINCTFDVSDGSTKFYTAGFSLSNGGGATINSGTFIGGTGAYIYSSGGTLNITGGYYEGRLDDGAGVGVAVHAHQDRNLTNDKDAIMNISGGEFKGAVKVTAGESHDARITISGGKFSDVSYSVNGSRASLVIIGGTFDVNPSTPTNYVQSGYSVKSEEIESKTWYTVYDSRAPQTDKTEITWSTAADWQSGAVPTSSSDVAIPSGKSVTVTTGIAQANSISLEGNATITVKKDAKLVVGKDGVTQTVVGENKPEIIVEDGGYFYISPDQAEAHPYGTVQYASGAMAISGYESGHIWQHIGIPTIASPTIGLETGYKTGAETIYLNTWNIKTGWDPIGLEDFDTPFKGYNFSNDATQLGSVYTFSGNLVGSTVEPLVFSRQGYSFFANSYTAPVNIRSMLLSFDDNVQRSVYIYNSLQETYTPITVNNAGLTVFGTTYPSEIKPMQGFFIFCDNTAEETLIYQDAVWRFALNVQAAPAREKSVLDGMAIQLTASNGRSDITTLLEGAEYTSNADDGEALKMANPATSVELYTVSANGNMAIYAAESLDHTTLGLRTNASVSYTLAFDNVTVDGYELFDNVTGISTAIVDGASYDFTAAANTTIESRMSIRKITDVSTNIGEIQNAMLKDAVYTVLGQYVGQVADWDNLPNGVYMVNGVKLVK